MKNRRRALSVCVWAIGCVLVLLSASTSGAVVGYLSTPDAGEIVAGGDWAPAPDGDGYRIDWEVSQNTDGSWHYEYWMSDANSGALKPATSHVILQLSENITSDDLYNFDGNVGNTEFGTFGEHPSNPGFPVGESIFGIKVELDDSQMHFEFDSIRLPMWGDVYAQGGKTSYAYNMDLGDVVANPHAFNDTPVNGQGEPLSKILVPNMVPEPTSLALAVLGGMAFLRRRQ